MSEQRKPRLLVACEFSGIVRKAFKEKGWDAWSCDLLPTERPGQHIQGDVLDLLARDPNWDMMIAHPPCTYLSYAGVRHWNAPGRKEKRGAAMEFFMKLINADIPKICVENPRGWPGQQYRKSDQEVHPYYFGGTERKRTALWLKNLPLLTHPPTNTLIKPEGIITFRRSGELKLRHFTDEKSKTAHERSSTFPEIALAMASQWTEPLNTVLDPQTGLCACGSVAEGYVDDRGEPGNYLCEDCFYDRQAELALQREGW